jgi:hypothetical protein
LERARRQAERAQQEAEREAAIAQLQELRRQMTSIHLQSFAAAQPPVILAAPQLGLPWALAEAQAFHLQGVGRLARAERTAAKQRAQRDAPAYLAAETARLRVVREQLVTEAGQWWDALLSNDEVTVCEAVNTAFSDNPAAGCAVGVDGTVLSVVMRQQDLDTMPTQTAGLTPSGRPTLKNLAKRDRLLWWLTAMGSTTARPASPLRWRAWPRTLTPKLTPSTTGDAASRCKAGHWPASHGARSSLNCRQSLLPSAPIWTTASVRTWSQLSRPDPLDHYPAPRGLLIQHAEDLPREIDKASDLAQPNRIRGIESGRPWRVTQKGAR